MHMNKLKFEYCIQLITTWTARSGICSYVSMGESICTFHCNDDITFIWCELTKHLNLSSLWTFIAVVGLKQCQCLSRALQELLWLQLSTRCRLHWRLEALNLFRHNCWESLGASWGFTWPPFKMFTLVYQHIRMRITNAEIWQLYMRHLRAVRMKMKIWSPAALNEMVCLCQYSFAIFVMTLTLG